MAIGIKPRIVASEVIKMGRSRKRDATETASRSGFPSWRMRLANSTIKMLFDTTIPTIITTPINDITFSVVPVANRNSSTPASPGGIASKMMNGSSHEANCATKTRYTSTTERIRPSEALERRTHPLHRPAEIHANAFRQRRGLHDAFDLTRHAPQVFPYRGNVQIEDPPELIVIDLRRRLHPLDIHYGVQRGRIH